MDTTERHAIDTELSPDGRRARAVARMLPLFALAVWVVMIWVPVLDSGNEEGPRIRITSLGDYPVDAESIGLAIVLPWVAIILCAAFAWFTRWLIVWSPMTVILGLVLLVALSAMIMDPPLLMWDGMDAQGRWVGGMEIGHPAPGAFLWALGSSALIAGGVCGLSGSRHCRHRRHVVR